MAKRAGKTKSFAIRYVLFLLVLALMLEAAWASASTVVDLPIFRLTDPWVKTPNLPQSPNFETVPPSERTAVETLLLEAAGDGFSSMVAVGETIRNRMELFHKDAASVCLQPWQFSGWNDRARAARFLKDHRGHYGRAWLAWQLSAVTHLTDGATDYHEQSISPSWAAAYTRTAQVGSHLYYVRQARRIRAESGPVPA